MIDRVGLSRALATAVRSGGPGALLAVCRACVEWLPITGAAITVMVGPDGHERLCATDAAAERIDELQFSLGEGPCVESFTSGRAVLVDDVTGPAERRWPVFAASAAESGTRGIFAFPLSVGAVRLGVLECYRDTPGQLTDQELAGALRVADAAVWVLLERVELEPPSGVPADTGGAGTGDWLDGAPLGHAEVHQATGMLMASAGIDARAALARLRAAAFEQGRELKDIAVDILHRRLWLAADGYWHTTAHDTVVTESDGPIDKGSGNEEKPS